MVKHNDLFDIVARLRRAANSLERDCESESNKAKRARMAYRYATEAGRVLLEAWRLGVFDGEGSFDVRQRTFEPGKPSKEFSVRTDLKALIDDAVSQGADDADRSQRVFRSLWQHWLTTTPVSKRPTLEMDYADYMRALADYITRQADGASPTPPDDSAFVAAETLREQADGRFGPDGFYLDGKLVTGLTDIELALLTLALNEQPDGPTEVDVCKLTEFMSWTRQRIDKLLGTIKAKFLTAKSPRVLRWANKHLVFREARERAKAARKSAVKTRGRKPGRKRGETLQKGGRDKRGR